MFLHHFQKLLFAYLVKTIISELQTCINTNQLLPHIPKKCHMYKFHMYPQSWSCGVVVITSALHAEGPQFDPGRDQFILFT